MCQEHGYKAAGTLIAAAEAAGAVEGHRWCSQTATNAYEHRRVSQHPIQLDPTLKNQGKSLIRDLWAQNFLRLRRAENGASALDSAPEPLTETTPLPSTPVGSGEGVAYPGSGCPGHSCQRRDIGVKDVSAVQGIKRHPRWFFGCYQPVIHEGSGF